ncbi:MAG: DUF4838 domain-containing protein [Planctomycetes bacterium]|nr:DUF4838 domain-containing protein [Planctomycetota bacterium]
MGELLPRELFAKAPELFRSDASGRRVPDANLCASSERALEVASENAVALARVLRPTTGRYFLWGDDGRPWCRCARCAGLSESDQALLLENALLGALRREDPQARLAHLAYANTIEPPGSVRPAEGVFLEYAPLEMRRARELGRLEDPESRRWLDLLDANLAVFPRESAQALEYWLDVSMYSGWKKPARRLPFSAEAVASDLETYRSRGVRHVTSFAVYVDREYVDRHGEPAEVAAYGALLAAGGKAS